MRKYLNLMIVFLLSGLWHGASWNFIVWGGLNGAYQVLGQVTKAAKDKLSALFRVNKERFSYRLACMLSTFVLIDFTWIFFRAKGTITAFRMIRRIFLQFNPWIFFDGGMFRLGLDQKDFFVLFLALAILAAVSICRYRGIDLVGKLFAQGTWFRWMVYFVGLLVVLVYGIYGSEYNAGQFIYFQF